jgi:hypothetical protein
VGFAFLTDGLPEFKDDFEAFLYALLASVANENGASFFFADIGGLLSVITLCFPIVELSLTCSIALMSSFKITPLPGEPVSMFACKISSISWYF